MAFSDKIVIPLTPYEERIVTELEAETAADLAELKRLDEESELLFVAGDMKRASQVARSYARLRRQLEARRIEWPPSVSMWRAA